MERPDNASNDSCLLFTKDRFKQLFILRISLTSVVCLVCCVACLMIFITKAYQRFVHRLVLYLTLSAFCESLMFGMEVIPVTINNGSFSVKTEWEGICSAIGYFAVILDWCELFFICWVTLYLFLLAVFKANPFNRKHEIAGIILAVSLPLLFTWVPFLDKMYGLSGAWCWIRFTKGHDRLGLAYQIGMWYGPLILVLLITSFATVILVVPLCWGAFCSHPEEILQQHHRKALKEALPLIIYPIIYNIICCYAVANRIHYATRTPREDENPCFVLWILQSGLYSLRNLIIPLGFFLHPHTLGQMKRVFTRTKYQEDTQPSYTAYVVSADSLCTEEDYLVVKGRESDIKNYKSLFDAST